MSQFRPNQGGENQGGGGNHAADYELVDGVLPGAVARDLFGHPIEEVFLRGEEHLAEHVNGREDKPGENGQQQKVNDVHRDLGNDGKTRPLFNVSRV